MSDRSASRLLRWCARQIDSLFDGDDSLELIRSDALAKAETLGPRLATEAGCCASILVDLAAQGWSVQVERGKIAVRSPLAVASVDGRKSQVRAGLLVERDAQLASPSVRKFIREMERQRPHRGQWHSIFSLMRDGRELANSLERAAGLPESERDQALSACMDPYVQPISSSDVCPETGIRLLDAWRYFRHTWTTAYKSTPGRKMFFLVRDRAAPNHPVIGIGALGSAIVQLGARDSWIGWTGKKFLERLDHEPSASWATWLDRSVNELLANHRVDDLLRATRLNPRVLQCPTQNALDSLRKLAKRSRDRHRLLPQRALHKTASRSEQADWAALSSTHLFRAKRAESVATLLEVRMMLQRAGFVSPSAANLVITLSNRSGRRAIETLVRFVKARHVGVDMLDLTVCGAIAPYNAVLGGKLVSLLMASPEVINAYNKRYRAAASVIASAMAGKAIRRRPNLVLLGTTSLYDVAPSQYNRLSVPSDALGGPQTLSFVRIGSTEGYGSYQFSGPTTRLLEKVTARTQSGRRVNSIFGEGVNPKMRKVRGALDALGLDSDGLLKHGSPRLIFMIPLAVNFREILLGHAKRPEYIVPLDAAGAKMIANYWRRRWLANRIRQPLVLAAVSAHPLVHPIRHGARVQLMPVEDPGPLFQP